MRSLLVSDVEFFLRWHCISVEGWRSPGDGGSFRWQSKGKEESVRGDCISRSGLEVQDKFRRYYVTDFLPSQKSSNCGFRHVIAASMAQVPQLRP